MNTKSLILIVCLMLFCLTAASAARVPIGAFVTQPVNDVEGFCLQILQNPVVASRYSTHYKMDREDIVVSIRETLTLRALDKPQRVTAYFIADGRIAVHKKNLKAGTLVLVNDAGQPVIDFKCGNPLTKTLPKPAPRVEPIVETLPPPVVVPEPEPEPQLPPVNKPTVELLPIVFPEQLPVEPVVEVLDSPVLELTSIIAPALALVGAIGVVGGDTHDPVPEPNAILTLIMGLSGTLVAGSRFCRR